jgi:predicted porin
MQKKLLTLAVAGALSAPAVALAQVEVYGFVNMSFGKVKYDSVSPNAGLPAGAGSVSKWDVANHASNYGVRARENLGGGQTAWFQIEQNAPLERSNNTAITPASRNSAVGIQGGWGNLFIGQWTTPWADLDALWGVGTVGGWGPVTSVIGRRETTGTAPNINCANAGHGVAASCDAVEAGGGVGHAFWRRASQAVFYQSPVLGGFQAKAMYQTNEGRAAGGTGITADPSMWSASVQWAGMGGRLRVGAAFDRHEDFSTVGKSDTGWRVTGGWNFGFADIGLAYETMEYALSTAAGGAQGATYSGNDCEAKQWGVAIAIPVGSGAIRASFAQAEELDGTGCTVVVGNAGLAGFGGAKTWNIGYEHRFSKRTSVGFGYATIDNDDGSATQPGGTHNWTGLPPNQNGGAGSNGPLPGGDVSTFFVNMIHRF